MIKGEVKKITDMGEEKGKPGREGMGRMKEPEPPWERVEANSAEEEEVEDEE